MEEMEREEKLVFEKYLPPGVFGMAIQLVLKWIYITVIENNLTSKSKQFKGLLN